MEDLEQKSEAELETLMESIVSGQPTAAETEAPPPEPPPQTETAPVVEETPAEPVATEPAEPTDDELDKEAQKLELEELRARMKHLESVNGRLAGEVGFLRGRVGRQPEPAQEPEPVYEEEQARPQRRPDGLLAWNIQQAVREAGTQFVAAHPDFEELRGHITEKHGEGLQEQISTLMNMDDPMEAYKHATAVLDAVYYRAKSERVAAQRAEIEAKKTERKAEQTRKLSEAKAKATISATGAAPSPPPPTKSLNEMTFEEVDKLLKQLPR